MVLSLYGLRLPNDIDCLLADEMMGLQADLSNVELHDTELHFHGVPKSELIYNPEFFFIFENVKLISFTQVYRMKKARGEGKDITDCKMMESLVQNNKLSLQLSKVKQGLYYFRVRLLTLLMEWLIQIGLYKIVRSIYRFFKGRN